MPRRSQGLPEIVLQESRSHAIAIIQALILNGYDRSCGDNPMPGRRCPMMPAPAPLRYWVERPAVIVDRQLNRSDIIPAEPDFVRLAVRETVLMMFDTSSLDRQADGIRGFE